MKKDNVTMTTAQYAELFHVHRASVVKMCQNHKVSCKKIRVGKRMHWYVVLPRDVVEARILKNSEETRAKNVQKIRAEIEAHAEEERIAKKIYDATGPKYLIRWTLLIVVVIIMFIWML